MNLCASRKEARLKNVRYILFLFVILSLSLSFAGCKKQPPPIEPTPPVDDTMGRETGEQPPLVERPTEGELVETNVFEACTQQLQPVFFDYDRSEVRDDQIYSLQNNARVLKSGECSAVTVLIEGHCDERGTEEYNLALGERRARAAMDFLVSLGVSDFRLNILSYGESRPFAQGHNESAWSQNRRAHFVAVQK